jgi:hypothetical protein
MRGHEVHDVSGRVTFARAFTTRLLGDDTERVRTRGRVVRIPAGGTWSSGFAPEAVPVAVLDADAAHGKVAVLREASDVTETASFQLADDADDADIAACSNATAAAVACHSAERGMGRVALRLVLPRGHDARIVAEVRHGSASSSVQQTWHGVRVHLTVDTVVDGRHVAACTGALNNYLVVRTRPGETIDAFALDDALELWEHFGMHREPLLSRMAVVDDAGRRRAVRFFTCGTRAHPSAAPTGLAVLGCVSPFVDWLPPSGATVVSPGGVVHVPRIHEAGDGRVDVAFPEVIVTIAGS